MRDTLGRDIDYIRISVTDRCDLRCVYCMPAEGVPPMAHENVLSYEEILRLAKAFASLGIKKVRLTGGEPLVRKDLHTLVRGLKAIPGIETVFITTNGILLGEQLPALLDAGLDGVNISIDAIDEEVFERITRRPGANKVIYSIAAALACPELNVKLNCVPTTMNERQLLSMVWMFLKNTRLSLRFIELMPVGLGAHFQGKSEEEVRAVIEDAYGKLTPLPPVAHGGPCRYYSLQGFTGKVGFISAMSHKFCDSCNRVRLTANGFLKTCLQYDKGVALRPLLHLSDEELRQVIRRTIEEKPDCHHFTEGPGDDGDETHIMSQIGG
jgi:cyclic pyranopterin phosphate synthase